MFYKTISKILVFVISLLFVCFIASNCSFHAFDIDNIEQKNKKKFSRRFEKPKVIARIKSQEISESSGLVSSRCNKDIFWTHNDSRNGAFIFAVDRKGKKLGTWKVTGAVNKDWEDLATIKKDGKCFLYVGDIGNNSRIRSEFTVYRVEEPRIENAASASSFKNPLKTKRATPIKFSYPNIRRNSETLLVHPVTEDLYILSKRLTGAASVYKMAKGTTSLKKIADFEVPALPNGLLTGGEISSDGKRIILCDYFNGYEITLPDDATNFDEIWKEEPSVIELGRREQGEAICYSEDMTSVFATSERLNSPLIQVKRK